MRLFKTKEERIRKKREKARQKRAKQYEKTRKKDAKKEQIFEDANIKPSSLNKTFNFIDDIFSIFSPSHSRIRHDRLVKQGIMFLICSASLLGGLALCTVSYNKTEMLKAQAANFMTDNLAFSKSSTDVTAKTPFTTQDRKTIYIPLKISDMKLIDPDASQYHILVIGKDGDPLKSQITMAQLMSFGSTGNFYLIVKSANMFQNQPVQFLIWSGSDVTDDEFNPNDNDGLEQFKLITKKYDSLAFTINLGGKSIYSIPKTKTIHVSKMVTKIDTKTHKKYQVKKVVSRQVPIVDNQDLYNDNLPAFLYNQVVTGPALKHKQDKLRKQYARMQLAINRINKDKRALTQSGYILPKLPNWTTNRDNDIKKSMPFSYQQLLDFKLLQPNATFTAKQQKLLTDELRLYNKENMAENSNNSDNMTTEENYAANLNNKVIKNKHISKTLGNGGDETNSTDNDESEWAELQDEIAKLATLKNDVYYVKPLEIWQMYQDFTIATSSGKDKSANTGAITYSKLSGHNKHGKYLGIIRDDQNN